MNKKISILMVIVLCLLCLNSCSHKHSYDYNTEVVKPTCTKGGYTIHRCKCGDYYKSDETDPMGHLAWWEVTVKPSACTEGKEGERAYRCDRCGEVLETEKIDPTHDYVNNKCSKCGKIQEDSVYIEMPTLPIVITDGYATVNILSVKQTKVKEAYFEYIYYNCLTFEIQKLWDVKGTQYSRNCKIGYKLYNSEGFVIESSTMRTVAMCSGEKTTYYLSIDELKTGEAYRLELLDVD